MIDLTYSSLPGFVDGLDAIPDPGDCGGGMSWEDSLEASWAAWHN